jgi:hypothetical protein
MKEIYNVISPQSNNLTRGGSHCGLAVYIKKVSLGKKKNYENSNSSPCKNIIFKKSSKRIQNPLKIL